MSGHSRRLGQNFLIDPNIVDKIVNCLQDLFPETVLEIGPGQGALTKGLLQLAPRVLALERDPQLARELKARFPQTGLINADAMLFDWSRVDGKVEAIAGNLPYSIASPLMWEMAPRVRRTSRMVFMLQKEVAQRVASPPCSKSYGGLSVWLQSFARVRYQFGVSPNVFRPRPKVSSAVISLEPRPDSERPFSPESLSRLIRLCFQNRRKQLARTLKDTADGDAGQWLRQRGLSASSRPEELSPSQFEQLSRELAL